MAKSLNPSPALSYTQTCTNQGYIFKMYCNSGSFHVQKYSCVKFLQSWVDYENLTHIQSFTACVKGEHRGAAKTLLHLRLHVYSAIWKAAIGEELACYNTRNIVCFDHFYFKHFVLKIFHVFRFL